MQKVRLIYIENDPALGRFLSEMLSQSPDIEIVGTFNGARQVINSDLVQLADAALIDFSLEQDNLNGVELGIELRNLNENLALIIYSQFSVRGMISRVPQSMRSGWSFFEKSALMELDDYVSIIKMTTCGQGNWEEVLSNDSVGQESEAGIFFSLTPKQRSIMALASEGKIPHDIAMQLNLSYAYVRKELSRAYQILLPGADHSIDLHTAAIDVYRKLMRL
jgi:DNA-binding NarL/FixJ family response regulator